MSKMTWLNSGLMMIMILLVIACTPQWQILEYDSSKAPAGNPLKGFMPYVGEYEFPHSLEYFYIGMAEIVKGPVPYVLSMQHGEKIGSYS